MKNILIVCFIVLSINLSAQPILTSSSEASIGSSFTYMYLDTTNLSQGNGGANQVWDFTNIAPAGTTRVDNWVSVVGTPYAANFPASNIVQVTNAGTAFDIYLYHNKSSGSIELNGIAYDAGSGVQSVLDYSDSEILRNYPVTYNDSHFDTYGGVSMLNIPFPTTTYHTGTYEYIVDGYGSLQTLSGTYPNCLRFKVRQVYNDSTVYPGLPIPAVVVDVQETDFFWFSADPGDQLFQFYIGYDTSTTAGVSNYNRGASYLEFTTGINEVVPYLNNVSGFPNPAGDVMTFNIDNSVDGFAELQIVDVKGKQIKSFAADMKKADRYSWTIPVDDLSGGLYLIKINCKNKIWYSKFIKN